MDAFMANYLAIDHGFSTIDISKMLWQRSTGGAPGAGRPRSLSGGHQINARSAAIWWSNHSQLVADALLDPAPDAMPRLSRSRGSTMSVKGLRSFPPSKAVCPERLPVRTPGASRAPDGPPAVLPPIEQLERIAQAVRRWCAASGGLRGNC